MLYWAFAYLQHYYKPLSVFHYLTLRTVMASMTALGLSLLIGPPMIRRLTQYKINQIIRLDGPQSHLSKSGTPTMGGAMILISITLSTLLWADLSNWYIGLVIAVMLSFGAVGLVDDYRKLVLKHSNGLAARFKYLGQSVIALAAACILYYYSDNHQHQLLIPFFKHCMWSLGPAYALLSYLVIVGSSNAVNLTDGLDGLAIVPTVLVGGALGVFAYVTGHVKFADYLQLPYIAGVGEITVFCSALVGAGLGFLWFNAYPAQIFMGDVGSLALGAALGIVAVVLQQEIILFIMGGVFVMETVSVILQVGSFKLRRKRIFRMAPIHHHFELMGWPEPKVIVRFWILTVVFVLIGLASLKIR